MATAEMCPPTIQLLKNEAIDRLDSVVKDLPKYKPNLTDLIRNFTVEEVLGLINTIHRDSDFQASVYFRLYNEYFDEIEELIHRMTL